MIRVLITDDHELVRSGLEYILASDREINVIGTASSGEEALDLADALSPDIILMDINMPGIGGLEACHRLKRHHPAIRLIALSVQNAGPLPRHLLEAGVDGYISKHCPPDEMIRAIKSVYQGQPYLSSDVASHLAFASSKRQTSPFDSLSQREMEVAILTLQGKTIQDIADILAVSPKTICTYRYRLFDKLHIHNDVELTRLATKYGLLNGNDS